MCGGGPSQTQKQAQQSQANLANTMSGIFSQNQAVTNPALTNVAQNGLPFMSTGVTPYTTESTAQSFAPAKAQLATQLGNMGPLPSGFATSAASRVNEAQAQQNDSQLLQNNLLNFNAKMQALGMLNPLGYASGAQQGFNSVIQAPVQPSTFGSIFGGALGGLLAA